MRRNCASIVAIALAGLSCRHATPPPAAPPIKAAQPAATPGCVASLAESSVAGQPFPEDLLRNKVRCEMFQRIEQRQCPSVYTAIVEAGGFGGSTRYFDPNRKLIGVWAQSDTNQYCNGKSFDILYGTRPVCPAAEVVTSLCRP